MSDDARQVPDTSPLRTTHRPLRAVRLTRGADAIPLALELRHAAAYSLRLIGLPFGTALGFLYSVTTVSGPPLAIFFDNQGLVKKEFRAGLGGFAWLSQA